MSELNNGRDTITMENEILKFWDENDIIKKCLNANEGRELFRFVEGPPTANGSPGVHHVYARIVKDLFCRYKSMRGFYVPRMGGWDCHGLPVEISVEKALNLNHKNKIEEYGIESFNEICRYSVFSHIDEWSDMTKRIGFFLDLDAPYTTMAPDYIESVWWSLKRLWEKNLIYESYYVVPYCPRCGTALSTHEVAQGYNTIKEDSIFVKFPSIEDPTTYFLAWTTTPWTLLSNVALAVNPDVVYVTAEVNGEHLVFAKEMLMDIGLSASDYSIINEFDGRALEGKKYRSLFSSVESRIVLASFVTTTEGTGIVHIAPAFGEDDFNIAKANGLPMVQLVNPDGRFDGKVDLVGGLFFSEANPVIITYLRTVGLLFRVQPYEHSYPFCWRCETPLMYYARKAWFIKMSALRAQLIDNNEQINWFPKTIKHGRFGNFIENVRDWALSRERYWGTPLPIWKCDNNHTVFIGSINELQESLNAPVRGVHKPYIDEVILKCNICGNPMRRVSEVIDCWYDSGCAPFASTHYPFEMKNEFRIPVDFICEGVDQTRGWFYSLHAIATAVFDERAYNNVISLGHIVDEHGRKMSKSKGNSIDPWLIINNEGADSLRWYLFSSGPPGNPKKFYEAAVVESQRKFIMTLWNALAFYRTYSEIDRYDPSKRDVNAQKRPELDKWLLSRLRALTAFVNRLMDSYDYNQAALEIEKFVEDMSNWYIRTSRRRFWKSQQDVDKESAYDTLYEVLFTLAKLIAPFTPFIAEHIYQSLKKGHNNDTISVHLEQYPTTREPTFPEIEVQMNYVREIVEAGRAARAASNIKIRQPLRSIICIGQSVASDALRSIIMNELNVKSIDFKADQSSLIEYTVTLNFASVGPKYKKLIPDIKKALAALDPAAVVDKIRSNSAFEVEGNEILLTMADVIISENTKSNFIRGTSNSVTVFLDREITPELKTELLAREVVRRIQVMRREMELPYAAHIRTRYATSDIIAKSIEDFRHYIEEETLSIQLLRGEALNCEYAKTWTIEGAPVTLCIDKQDEA